MNHGFDQITMEIANKCGVAIFGDRYSVYGHLHDFLLFMFLALLLIASGRHSPIDHSIGQLDHCLVIYSAAPPGPDARGRSLATQHNGEA